MRKYKPVYVIICVTYSGRALEIKGLNPKIWITPKEIMSSQESAKKEVERLNTLNSGKGCLYVWQVAKLSEEETEASKDVYVVMRIDYYDSSTSAIHGVDPSTWVKVQEVTPNLENAKAEVERLNTFNPDENRTYFWRYSRLMDE